MTDNTPPSALIKVLRKNATTNQLRLLAELDSKYKTLENTSYQEIYSFTTCKDEKCDNHGRNCWVDPQSANYYILGYSDIAVWVKALIGGLDSHITKQTPPVKLIEN